MEMVVDVRSSDVFYTVIVYGVPVREQLAPMLMWGGTQMVRMGMGPYSWPWQWSAVVIISIGLAGIIAIAVDA